MVKCESFRINMFRITHTGKSVNFPVTLIIHNSCPLYLRYYDYSNNDYRGLFTTSQSAYSSCRQRDGWGYHK